MLPLLVKAILTTGKRKYFEDLSLAVSLFFSAHAEEASTDHNNTTVPNINNSEFLRSTLNASASVSIVKNKLAIRSMLNVVECIRIHNFK